MSLRALGSFFTRAMGSGTQAARSLQSSLRDLALRDVLDGVAVFAADASAGAGGTLAVQYYFKEEDMKARFEDWMKRHNKTYRDEEEKATRFQLFKATIDKFQRRSSETLHYYADWTDQERRKLLAYPDGIAQEEEFQKYAMDLLAKYEKGEPLMITADAKQGDTQAARVSS